MTNDLYEELMARTQTAGNVMDMFLNGFGAEIENKVLYSGLEGAEEEAKRTAFCMIESLLMTMLDTQICKYGRDVKKEHEKLLTVGAEVQDLVEEQVKEWLEEELKAEEPEE